jgi:hypothetical protein
MEAAEGLVRNSTDVGAMARSASFFDAGLKDVSSEAETRGSRTARMGMLRIKRSG